MIDSRILYEDNHLIAINKLAGELSQGDKTGDVSMIDDVKDYLKRKYDKKGNVYLGLPHRLDRPTSGVILFAKTDKALSRLSDLFRKGEVEKNYYAITLEKPREEEERLINYIVRDERRNISISYARQVSGSQKAILTYRLINESERYYLLDVKLETGRGLRPSAVIFPLSAFLKTVEDRDVWLIDIFPSDISNTNGVSSPSYASFENTPETSSSFKTTVCSPPVSVRASEETV